MIGKDASATLVMGFTDDAAEANVTMEACSKPGTALSADNMEVDKADVCSKCASLANCTASRVKATRTTTASLVLLVVLCQGPTYRSVFCWHTKR